MWCKRRRGPSRREVEVALHVALLGRAGEDHRVTLLLELGQGAARWWLLHKRAGRHKLLERRRASGTQRVRARGPSARTCCHPRHYRWRHYDPRRDARVGGKGARPRPLIAWPCSRRSTLDRHLRWMRWRGSAYPSALSRPGIGCPTGSGCSSRVESKRIPRSKMQIVQLFGW
jgi:hypothetical protein